ncbi:MAG: hypothetical protein ACP5RD_04970, partial [bacterium]
MSNLSRKYQRELAISNLFQIIFFKSSFIFDFLDDSFKNLLNKYLKDKIDIELKIWNIVRYTDFS